MTGTARHLLKATTAALALTAGSVVYAVPISETFEITEENGIGSVGYFFFDVTGAGLFDIYTDGPSTDPYLFLFRDDGSLDTADFVAEDDDGCDGPDFCDTSGDFFNSLITTTLSDGSYVAATSDYELTLVDAISGFNTNINAIDTLTGPITITVAANAHDAGGAFAVARSSTPVPEPGALALLGIGALAGLSSVRRRRSA